MISVQHHNQSLLVHCTYIGSKTLKCTELWRFLLNILLKKPLTRIHLCQRAVMFVFSLRCRNSDGTSVSSKYPAVCFPLAAWGNTVQPQRDVWQPSITTPQHFHTLSKQATTDKAASYGAIPHLSLPVAFRRQMQDVNAESLTKLGMIPLNIEARPSHNVNLHWAHAGGFTSTDEHSNWRH